MTVDKEIEHIVGRKSVITNCFDGCRAYVLEDIRLIPKEEMETLFSFVPLWRQNEALAFKHEERRRECILSYILLMYALQYDYGICERQEFDYLPHGKPVLCNHSDIHFNLSHCREAVACIMGGKPVGIDVERRGRYKETLARKVLDEGELQTVLQAEDPDLEFTKLWTRKEALLKMTGEGISGDMRNVFARHPDAKLHTFEKDAYVCSLATQYKYQRIKK